MLIHWSIICCKCEKHFWVLSRKTNRKFGRSFGVFQHLFIFDQASKHTDAFHRFRFPARYSAQPTPVNQFVSWITREFFSPSKSFRAHNKISKQQQQKHTEMKNKSATTLFTKRARETLDILFPMLYLFIYYYFFEPLPFSHLMRSKCFFCLLGMRVRLQIKRAWEISSFFSYDWLLLAYNSIYMRFVWA